MATLKAPLMRRSSSAFLQIVIVFVALGALALLLWEPQVEGVNADRTQFEIYFKDPFIAYIYLGSIPFFVALYHAFKVLGYAGQNKIFSQRAVNSLRIIKYCAIAVIAFVAGAEIVIMLHTSDDRAGGVFMGVLITFASVIIATAAATFQSILQKAVDLKSENDLTV